MPKQLTREEIEARLEKKYTGRVIGIMLPYPPPTRGMKLVSGKIDRLSVEITDTVPEPMVRFVINSISYRADVNYFTANVKLYGNPH